MAIRLFFRNIFSGVILLVCMSVSQLHAADGAVERLSRAFPKENPDKVEVIEFFSYGCGHCSDFHPIITKWAESKSAEIHFRRVPVVWNRQWGNLARLYYTLESLGELERLDNAVFDAINKERRNELFTEKGAARWYVAKNGNEQKFTAAYNSFGVMSKVSQAENLARDMEIASVPTLIVEGQYRVQGEFAVMLKTADQLIERAKKK